jgi:hypothetical protein
MKKARGSRPEKLVVYTVLIGDKEELNDPLRLIGHGTATDLAIEFVCLTDDPSRNSPTWRMETFGDPLIPTEKLSRLPKARPDLFFPKHARSLYIDNTVVFKRLPRMQDFGDAHFRGFRHPWRSHPLDEADIVAKSGLDDPAVVAAQMRFYEGRGLLTAVTSLTAGTVLLRCHNEPKLKKFGRLWWEQVLLFSKRDQLSLDLCAAAAGCPVNHFPGDKRDNDLFFWPALPTGRRVLGSFDADLYAWMHRDDPAAVASPRAHYLAGGEVADDRYQRRVGWFDYLCQRVGCGLGITSPPRRGVAAVLDRYLLHLEGRPGRILAVGIDDAGRRGTAPGELALARVALERYFRFSLLPDIVTVSLPEADLGDPAPYYGADGKSGFDIVLVIGLPARRHPYALSKFVPLLGPAGKLIIAFDESLPAAAVAEMRRHAGQGDELAVYSGHAIDVSGPIPSAIFVIEIAP